jgi:hypothetical protein
MFSATARFHLGGTLFTFSICIYEFSQCGVWLIPVTKHKESF